MAPFRGVVIALALLPAARAAIAAADAGDSWSDGDGCTSIIVAAGGVAEGGTITTHTVSDGDKTTAEDVYLPHRLSSIMQASYRFNDDLSFWTILTGGCLLFVFSG
jgi:hypothetical protein